jgi:hypothetical protein
MNTYVPALFQPLNQHLEAVPCERIPNLGSFRVFVAEIVRSVIFMYSTSASKALWAISRSVARDVRTAVVSDELVNASADQR